MKKSLSVLFAGMMVVSLATAGFAMKGHDMIKGEVTKIEGEMVTVKDEAGKEHMLHIDAKSTKKEGKIEVGAHVEADAEANGHAKSIKVQAMGTAAH
jgi:ribosomal protein S1